MRGFLPSLCKHQQDREPGFFRNFFLYYSAGKLYCWPVHTEGNLAMLSSKSRKNLKILASVTILSGLVGIFIAARFEKGFGPTFSLVGFFVGAGIGVLCASGNLFFLPRLEKWPFTPFILVKTLYFTAVTWLILYLRFAIFPSPLDVAGRKQVLLYSTLITLVISFAVSLFLLIYRMLGQNALFNFLSGRYHRPAEEERIIMFLDIASSTTIAEKIGHRRFLDFLNDFFFDVTDAVLVSGGEIYKYVGDAVIVVWKLGSPGRNAACLTCFSEIGRIIEEHGAHYLRKYGFAPEYRAGIHCGRVVIGEIGDFKREIAFLGDTVNTAARIQEVAKNRQRRLLVSVDLIERISLPASLRAESIGEVMLRGKMRPLELFDISAAPSVALA